MQYMLMCYFDEKLWEKLPDSRRKKIMDEYGGVIEGLKKSGHWRATAKLQETSNTTTVRERNGKRVITDGPFAETKEQLGGFHIVECRDLDEAIAIAGRIPTLAAGGSIEVRPVESASLT